jgi:excisionase family DNA binding protein
MTAHPYLSSTLLTNGYHRSSRLDILKSRKILINLKEMIAMKTDAEVTLVIDVVEAGRRLGLGRSAAYQAVHAGQIPSVRIGGLIKVPVAALQRMLDLPRVAEAGQSGQGSPAARPRGGAAS